MNETHKSTEVIETHAIFQPDFLTLGFRLYILHFMNHLEVSIISSLLIEYMHRPRLQFVYARGAALIDNMFQDARIKRI